MHGQPTLFQLGSPAASLATAVLAATLMNTAANTETALTYVSDALYGRTMIVTPSGDPGNSFSITLYGQDYLGQPMTESFTGATGSTAVLYGKKAFFRMLKVRNVVPATNAITVTIGTGTKLGLPYKGDLAYAMENNLEVPFFKRDMQLAWDVNASDAVAGLSAPLIAPSPGFVKNVFGASVGLGGAAPSVLTVKLATVAIVGLTASITQNSPNFTTGVPTTAGYNANNRLLTNGVIQMLAAAAAGGFPFTMGVTFTPTQFTLPDLTDPATVITGDPRGIYEPFTAPNGNPVAVGLVGDMAVNASGNGGLYGIQHYFNAAGT